MGTLWVNICCIIFLLTCAIVPTWQCSRLTSPWRASRCWLRLQKDILFGFSLFKILVVFPINLNIIISTITVIILNTVIAVIMIISLVTWNGLKGWEGESGLGAGWGPEVRRLRFKTIKTVKILGLWLLHFWLLFSMSDYSGGQEAAVQNDYWKNTKSFMGVFYCSLPVSVPKWRKKPAN